MEQKGKSKGILENGIDLEQVLNTNKHEKKKVARRRWAILAKALKVCGIACIFVTLGH